MKKNKKILFEKKRQLKIDKENTNKLIKDGIEIENIIVKTYDYDINDKNLFEKNIFDYQLENINKEREKELSSFLENNVLENNDLNLYKKCLFGDWWRVYFKSLKKMYYVNIQTPNIYFPSLLKIDFDNLEEKFKIQIDRIIINLIYQHYYKVFGFKKPYYLKESLSLFSNNKKYKDTYELIEEWINNKDRNIRETKEYKFYLNQIFKNNKNSILLDKIYSFQYNSTPKWEYKNTYNIIIPFNFSGTYLDLFKLIENNEKSKHKLIQEIKNNIYEEFSIIDNIKNNNTYRMFLKQFIPQKIFYCQKKKKIRKKI